MSLPVRERGLKFEKYQETYSRICVAPRAGAWIEMLDVFARGMHAESLPVRERGLK